MVEVVQGYPNDITVGGRNAGCELFFPESDRRFNLVGGEPTLPDESVFRRALTSPWENTTGVAASTVDIGPTTGSTRTRNMSWDIGISKGPSHPVRHPQPGRRRPHAQL